MGHGLLRAVCGAGPAPRACQEGEERAGWGPAPRHPSVLGVGDTQKQLLGADHLWGRTVSPAYRRGTGERGLRGWAWVPRLLRDNELRTPGRWPPCPGVARCWAALYPGRGALSPGAAASGAFASPARGRVRSRLGLGCRCFVFRGSSAWGSVPVCDRPAPAGEPEGPAEGSRGGVAPAPSLCEGASAGRAEAAGDFAFKTGQSVQRLVAGPESGEDVSRRHPAPARNPLLPSSGPGGSASRLPASRSQPLGAQGRTPTPQAACIAERNQPRLKIGS